MIAEVANMERSNRFYRDILGLRAEFESPHWSSYTLAGIGLGLHPPFGDSAPVKGGGWVLGVETECLRALRAHLELSGVACGGDHEVPSGVIMNFQDPD